ncbi:molybdenum ABC transporter ATP-binding protein [Bradyrhizobium pachyrhizi]|uniref:molybdenum ABC transporter ATP-binding protein n=1 Tax=Bradyrhizobium pachyrhizi TaxID=280333 RepID=UPI0024B25BB9|nr:molybdenum ABC transporter ATP-binding protein [Bradyrhizobium pachyrhizi]WFU54665.1 molybdenum ABC transporter ATP-binding protein [Bradyrhizobium pachyrhizi]
MKTAKPGRIEVAFSGSLANIPLDAQFDVPASGMTAIFGPPGCGKTTVARCIAGFQHLPAGFCKIDGEVWQDATTFRPAHLRPVSYVFRHPTTFAHLSVRSHLLYAAPKSGPTLIGFEEVVELFGLASFLDRAPSHLSAGERQRVAMARALMFQPRLLVLDEPLVLLDRSARLEILPFLERMHETLTLPMIYVGTDLAEVEHFADHLVMMKHGRVTAAGPLHVLQSDPALWLAARSEAAMSLDAVVGGYDGRYGLIILRLKGARLLVPGPPLKPGARQRLRIAACDVGIAREAPRASSILNVFPARIKAALPFSAAEVTLVLALETGDIGAHILARITRRAFHAMGLRDGMDVVAEIARISLVSASERPLHAVSTSNLPTDAGPASTVR